MGQSGSRARGQDQSALPRIDESIERRVSDGEAVRVDERANVGSVSPKGELEATVALFALFDHALGATLAAGVVRLLDASLLREGGLPTMGNLLGRRQVCRSPPVAPLVGTRFKD